MFLRDVPGQVWPVKADCQEERSRMLLAQIALGPGGQARVLGLGCLGREPAPVEMAGPGNAVYWLARRVQEPLELKVRLPRGRLVLRSVKGLAAAQHLVSVQHEVLRQRDRVRQGLTPHIGVVVYARGRRPESRHQACSGRIARRGLAIGARERDAAPRKPVDVGRDGLRVAAQRPDPVVEVVYADE